MDETVRAARNALGRATTRYAPDDRVAAFEVRPTTWDGDGRLVLDGAVSTTHLRDRAVEAVEAAVDVPVDDRMEVLESEATDATVVRARVAVRGHPGEDGERVTELRYGQAVEALDLDGDWRRVRCPDGYLGWVSDLDLADQGIARPDAFVTVPRVEDPELVNGRTETNDGVDVLYLGTPCERVGLSDSGEEVTVRFRTGRRAVLPADAVGEPPVTPTGEDVVAVAESFLGTGYRWGGMTADGIDCSGLAWVAYRANGVCLPRDADQQGEMGRPVERRDLRPGDLLFFPGHVAISTGGSEVVHAESAAGGVVGASLDPDATAGGAHHTGYDERLDEEFETARRLL